MESAYHFFLKHAGYSYRPEAETPSQGRIRCAKEYARAERLLAESDCIVQWFADDDADGGPRDWGWSDEECREWEAQSHTVERAALVDSEGNMLASLCGIWDASPEYRRVIEAELACEAIEALEGVAAAI